MDMSSLNPSYIGLREDILNLIPNNVSKVLDIGCSTGVLGENIKKGTHVEVIGVEIDEQMGEIAKKKLDKVIIGNIEKINLSSYFSSDYFNCIFFADTLEHLIDPWSALKSVTNISHNI